MIIFQEYRIQQLKSQFSKASKGLPYEDMGEEGLLNQISPDPLRRLSVLQSRLIAQLTLLAQASLDQILVSIEIMRHLQFFGREVLKSDDLLNAEGQSNGRILEEYLLSSSRFLEEASDFYDTYHSFNDDEGVSTDSKDTQVMVDNFNQQLERFYELDDEVRFYEKRQASGHPIFDADQKPKLNGKTTRIALSDLYQSTVGNTERSINLSIDYATLLLVRMQLIKNREVLGIPDLNARWKQQTFSDYDKLKDTISHIDVLTGIRQDRLGFLDRKLI
ncbi:MAG: hypothetical protein A3J37_00100 [Alphaproteobacteria bacterium RIFCSPHIGHO2_12_FULL_45_9]|nr:MAG: hypothetical protein A3B66_08705 [Alphaproteobacteria bacterium RIFCSPHIGHO2_02_FULL_46_13]OFW93450.1 MAG: hypothetical protein A3J37_00100 [Alphaproteobacteria bacterium RIFCSPHIGHO2_12_FULL_45_9]